MPEQQAWRPIDAGDETLRDALNEANIPALMTALYILTAMQTLFAVISTNGRMHY